MIKCPIQCFISDKITSVSQLPKRTYQFLLLIYLVLIYLICDLLSSTRALLLRKKKEVFKIVTLSEMIIIQEEFLESSYLNSYVFSSETTIKTRSFRMHKMALYPLVFHGLHKKAIHTANCDEKLSYWKTAEYEK